MNRNGNPEPKHLDTRLDAYFASAASSRNWKDKLGDWSKYAAAAGSALALTSSASAAIIYSGPQNVTDVFTARSYPFVWGTKLVNLNVDGQGNSFRLNLFTVQSGGSGNDPGGGGQVILSAYGGAGHVLGTGGYLRRLASGAVISTGDPGWNNVAGLLRFRLGTSYGGQITAGKWPDVGNTGFAGIKFTEGGSPHLGWIRLEFAENSFGTPYSITAIDWAYNDVAGASIRAGQTSSIPEPGTASLALLAAGCVGLAALRKRRKNIIPAE